PSELTICTGASAILHAYQVPGFSVGFPYRYVFDSDAPEIAEIHGFASGQSVVDPGQGSENGNVFVTGRKPGIAHVHETIFNLTLSTITVLPPIQPIEVHADKTFLMKGQQVVLTASVPGYNQQVTYLWYRGRNMDAEHLIQTSSDPNLLFIATSLGTSYISVQASACAVTSSAEIAIEVVEPRKHAARH
ncbi:MAG TPA: hypothetical protein VEZ11_18515, partial [Thermoanaerobaculia bacterium]|nr:hypothetical protein [Thermoanaerobaculia bacterium]